MTGDWVFDACAATILFSIVGVGMLVGYAIGNYIGMKKGLR